MNSQDIERLLSRPNAKAGRLQRACLEVLWEHERDGALPTSGRFVYYELEGRSVTPKVYRDASGKEQKRTPAQDVADALLVLREQGIIPWEWLVDETRSVTSWQYAESAYHIDGLPSFRL